MIGQNLKRLKVLDGRRVISLIFSTMWFGVAVQHVWFVVHRIAIGEWAGVIQLTQIALCLAAVGYASLKVCRIRTIFDSAPRRAWVGALLLILIHGAFSAPTDPASASTNPSNIPAVLISIPLLGALAVGLLAPNLNPQPTAIRLPNLSVLGGLFALAHLPLLLTRPTQSLLKRPPPSFA